MVSLFFYENVRVFRTRFTVQKDAKSRGINANAALTNAIVLYPSAAKINPLPKLPTAAADPINKSLKPCVRERSNGES